MLIKPSVLESNKHGVKIGSVAYNDILKGEELITEAYANGYDIVKVQCNTRNIDMFNRVEALGLPYAVAQTVVQSRLNLANYTPAVFNYAIDFELAQIPDAEFAESLVYSILQDTAVHYFDTPINNALFTKKAMIALHAEFIKDFIVNPSPDRLVFFYKQNNNYLGFMSVLIEGDVAHPHLGGVVAEYRQQGCTSLGYKKIIEQELIPRGLKTAYVEFQLQNIPSILAAMLKGDGFYPAESFIRMHLFPLASYIPSNAKPTTAVGLYTKQLCSKHIKGTPGTVYNVLSTNGYTLQAQQVLNNGITAGYHYFEYYD